MSWIPKIGAQGEAMVINELTQRGWAAAKPILDLGVDILACKVENRKVETIAIQVKTKSKRTHGHGTCYGFSIKRDKIIDGVCYIIACPRIQECIILTSEQIRKTPHLHRGRDREWDEFKGRWDLLETHTLLKSL